MSYQPQHNVTEGAQTRSKVTDDQQQSLLFEILQQLKILNVHMAAMTGMNPEKDDTDLKY